jgi:hypothetical protein
MTATTAVPAPDRRVAKTKAALRDAMLALMVPKGWGAITIQAICTKANVGRRSGQGVVKRFQEMVLALVQAALTSNPL